MKKLLLSSATALFIASPAVAKGITGVIEAIDQDRGLIMMENGQEFVIAEGSRIGNFEPGTEVRIELEDTDGEPTVKSIYRAAPKDE